MTRSCSRDHVARDCADRFAAKLVDYARVQTLAHYLIIDTERRVVIHHRKTSDGFATSILPGRTLVLDPPGLTLDLNPILEAAD